MDFQLDLEAGASLVVSGQSHEQLHAPWRATLTAGRDSVADASGMSAEEAARAWVGARASLRVRDEFSGELELPAVTKQGVVRRVHVADLNVIFELVSPLALLGEGQDQRVFVEKTTLEIVTQLLSEASLAVDDRCTRKLQPRRQCVQHWESRLAFISRILAEEGITYHCAFDGGESVVLVDSPEVFEVDEVPLLAVRTHGMLGAARRVHDAHVRFRRRTESVLLNEWNYEAPSADLASPAGDAQSSLEHYAFHADFRTPEEGKLLAQLTLESLRRDARVLEGKTPCRELAPGRVIEVDSEESAVRGSWLVTEIVSGRGLKDDAEEGASPAERDAEPFVCEFKAVPKAAGYRPAQSSVASDFITSSQVTGAEGSEIHPDDQLRVKLRQHADRRGATGSRDQGSAPLDTDSAWCRVMQPNMSGSMLIPRVNWEVLCAHWGSGSREPVVLGRMVNALFPPPNNLPAEKTTTAFGTRSTPAGGGKGNRIAFDDTKGKEGMHFNAGSAMSDKTTKDKTTTVTADESHSVSGSRSLATGQVFTQTTGGAEVYSVGTRTVSVTANKSIVAGSETIVIGGARIFCVGGEQGIEAATLVRCVAGLKTELPVGGESRKVKGSNITVIGGALLQAASNSGVSVGGINNEAVAGPKVVNATNYALSVTGVLTESYGARLVRGAGVEHIGKGAISINCSGASTLSGANVVFEAQGSITIEGWGGSIKVTGGSVEVDADFDSSGNASNSNSQKYA
ncbi:MAG: type VI secretion system Vgr family protein [Polyangiaceae bacterium]